MTLDDLKALHNQPGSIIASGSAEKFARLGNHLIALCEAVNSEMNNEKALWRLPFDIEEKCEALNAELSKL